MDPTRFDAIARSAATPATRRAALGALAAGGLLGALGLGRAAPSAAAQGQGQDQAQSQGQGQGGLCVAAFVAMVRQGPSAGASLVAGGASGELRGDLRFSLSSSGELQNADLLLADGSSLPVVGQATGHALQLRVNFGQGRALVAVGVGEQPATQCLGPFDGPATGPEVGDLGEWHAAAGVQNLPGAAGAATAAGGASQSTGTRPSGSGQRGSGQSGGGQSGGAPAGGAGGASSGGGTPPTGGSTAGSTGGTGEGSAGGGSGPACPSGQTRCGGACVDLRRDVANCGACGNRCAVNNCTRGVCGEATAPQQNCAPPFALCAGACVDTRTDPANCGGCGLPCASDLGPGTCTNGVCDCLAGTTRCGNACVSLQRDPSNCGTCGNVCTDNGTCDNGTCVITCVEGTTRCGGACVDTRTDPANCGTCGTACAAGETCAAGACAPPAPVACAEQGASCATAACCVGFCGQDDLCTCVGNGTLCAQTGTGGCCDGQPCNADGYCGVCRLLGVQCDADADCCTGDYAALCCFDGVTLTTRCTDVTNIGFVCPVDPIPPEPVTCEAGRTDCAGVCVDTKVDQFNCGGCGNLCLTGVCSDGRCPDLDLDLPFIVAPEAPADGAAACLAAGEPCDPADPGACCGGACGGDGYCL